MRRARLRAWVGKYGVPQREKSYFSQLLGGNSSFGEKAARRLERDYGMDPGYLDGAGSELSVPLTGELPALDKGLQSDRVVIRNDATAVPIKHKYEIDPAKYRKVFVVGKAPGGIPERIWTDGDIPVGATDEYAEIATADSHAFLVPVVGDEMSPKYEPGEYALVEPGVTPEVGEDVLVRLSDGQTILKRLYRRLGDTIVLKSLNPFKAEEFSFSSSAVVWMYYVAHPVPARKIRSRIEP